MYSDIYVISTDLLDREPDYRNSVKHWQDPY